MMSYRQESEEIEMENQDKLPTRITGSLLVGALLIFLGFVFLVGRVFDLYAVNYLWTFMVIIPGVLLFFLALAVNEALGQALAIVSGILTMVGVILLVQNLASLWMIWSYAWALVAPTSAGLGLWLFGSVKDRADVAKSGKNLTLIGLVIFAIAATFIDSVIGVNEYGPGRYGVPLLLIALGFFLLFRNIRRARRPA